MYSLLRQFCPVLNSSPLVFQASFPTTHAHTILPWLWLNTHIPRSCAYVSINVFINVVKCQKRVCPYDCLHTCMHVYVHRTVELATKTRVLHTCSQFKPLSVYLHSHPTALNSVSTSASHASGGYIVVWSLADSVLSYCLQWGMWAVRTHEHSHTHTNTHQGYF